MRPLRWWLGLLAVVLLLLLVTGQSWATYRFFTSRFPGGNDFYSRWANGCALIWSGENPYSDEVTLRTQIGMYGRPARVGEEDLAAYSYPLYALFFFWPLCFIRIYPLVQAIWMTLMLYALLAGVVLTARVARWRPPGWLWGVTLVWAVFNYPHARAILLGQMATVVFLGWAATLWALGEGRDRLAGALLATTTIKPQMSFLLVPWALWWAAWRNRWGVWKGFAGAMAILAGGSFLLVPTWLGDLLHDLATYDLVAATEYHSLTWIVVRHFLGLGPVVEAVITVALVLYGATECWRMRRADWHGFLWTTGLTLILTQFVAYRVATTHYSMLLLPLLAWFVALEQRLGRRAAPAVVGIEVALLVGQWALFLATLQGNYETAPVYLPFPTLMLAVQVLSRRQAVATEK